MSSTDATDDLSEGVSLPSRSSRRLKRLMLLLLWAPAAWIIYFWMVYLVTEVACVDQSVGTPIGVTTLIAFVVVSTVVALVGVCGVLPWARRSARRGAAGGLPLTVVLIVGCFVLAVVAVGLPALVLDPC